MSNDMTSSFVEDVKETCETNKDSLYNRLNTPSTDYARITIYTTAEALTSNDADLMEFNDPTILNLVKNEYKRLTNVLTYQECNIFIFTDVFYVVPNANSGVIANRDKLFKDYLHLSDKFRDINKHFYIDESLTVTEVENQFYLNQNKDNIETQNHYFTTTQNTGRYTIQAAYIQVKTTKICVPNDTNDGRTSYQGVLNTDDGSSSVSLSENGYVLTVPAKADLSNLFVGKEYNTKHYNYVWEFYPYYQQMSAEYMINLLDQDISVNSKNSYVYGYNQYYEIDLIIPPPKGLASLAKFSYSKAVVKTRDDKMVNTYFDMNIPDFSFLPLEIETGSNSCNINYTDVNTVEVKIIGTTKLSSATYRSEFIKTTSIQYYTVTLYAIDGVLTFDSIRQDFLPSLETGSINILTSDQASLDNLARFQITEENTIIQNPIIEINFYEYYVYRISGSIKYGDGNGDWCSVKAELSNLDGEVLSYMRFYFPSAQSLKTYNTFFNTQDGDSGFRSLTINDFQVISSNRDFNMDKLDALRHTSIIAYSSSGVILKDGVTVFMNAQLLTDCLDYTFCRYIKKLEIPSNFNLTGLYVSKNTKLESEMVDMRLGNTFYFKNNTLQIKIGNDGSNNYSYLKVKGDMIVAVDPDTDQTFNGVWRFGKEDSSAIFVSGTSHGVYTDVFETSIVDLTENEISTQFTIKQDNYDFVYTASGVLGKNCYSRDDLIDYSNESIDNYDTTIYSYSSSDEYIDENGNIIVMSNTCKLGETKFYINEKLENNYYSSIYNFTSIDDLMRTVFTVMTDDKVEYLTNSFILDRGLNLTYSFKNSMDHSPLPFVGETNFLGLDGDTEILVHLDDNYADLTFTLPSFTIGGGNVQFLTYDDFISYYNIDKKHCKSSRFDHHIDCDDFAEPNTLSTSLPANNLHGAQLYLDSNVLMFDILFRYNSVIGGTFTIPITGLLYNGRFQAEIYIDVVMVEDIQKETSSVSRMTISQNDQFHDFVNQVNSDFKTWVKSIILADNFLKIKMKVFEVEKESLEQTISQINCEDEEVCEEYPSITCSQYALEPSCIETTDVCSIMSQECTKEESICARSSENGSCYEYVSICKTWENKCIESASICIDFEEYTVPNECLKVELKCTRVMKQNDICLNSVKYLNKQLDAVNEQIALINEWVGITSELVDSSVCSIKVSDSDDREKYTSCTNKQVAIDPYSQDVDILDLVSIKNTTSKMMLREITSSDNIIFKSDIQLYGDWSTTKSNDHLIVSMSTSEEEYKGDEYDVNMKSKISINHFLNFISIDGSSSGVANLLEQSVCKEFGINDESAARMQVILRDLSDLNIYPQICQHYTEIQSKYMESQDKEGKDQESIYGTISGEGSGSQYTETKMYTSKTTTGIEELVYVYSSDPKTVEESQLKHSYTDQITGDDEDLLGLDQRLISAEKEKQDLSTLTDEELEQKNKEEEEQEENETKAAYEEAEDILYQQENQDKENENSEEEQQEQVQSSNESRIDSLQETQTESVSETSTEPETQEIEETTEELPVFEQTTTVEKEVLDENSVPQEQGEVESEESQSIEQVSEEDSIDASTNNDNSGTDNEASTTETEVSSESETELTNSSETSQEYSQEQA